MISMLDTFVLAMVKYPKVQVKAQKELDLVIGKGNLPTLSDEESLPYTKAIMKECLRWQIVTPLGIPHTSTEDDVYKGFTIPAGSIVMANAWSAALNYFSLCLTKFACRAMFHDEKIYPDSYTFNPDRFIKEGKIDLSVQDPELIAFGFGRRVWWVSSTCSYVFQVHKHNFL